VVSENLTLMRNMKKWFARRISRGDLIIDHVETKTESKKFMADYRYDHIFHNGMYIIDAIERYQSGTGVWNIGNVKNNYQNTINVDDRKSFSRIFNKKYLQSGVNIGGSLAIITVVVGMITWGVTLRADVDNNIDDIGEVKTTVVEIKKDQKISMKELNELTTAFKYVYKDQIEKAKNENLDK